MDISVRNFEGELFRHTWFLRNSVYAAHATEALQEEQFYKGTRSQSDVKI